MGRRLPPDRRLRELEAIYREHHRRVRWTLRARAVPEIELDDLVHDAFIAIFARLEDRDAALPMATWVVGVARNVAFSHRRSHARRRRAAQPDAPLPAPAPDEELARRRAWVQLEAFLHRLDATQREVFVLADVMGMRIPEVASVVDAPLNTLYSRLRIARRRFSDHFGDAAEAALREAAEAEAPRRAELQRGWAVLAIDLLPRAAWLGGGIAPWAVLGTAAIGLAAVVAIASPSPASPPIVATPEVRPAAPAPEVVVPADLPPAASLPPASLATPVPSRAESAPSRATVRRPAPEPKATAVDDFALVVDALRDARQRINAGDRAGAREILARVPATARSGPLAAELAKLERSAAEEVDPPR
jgi:RNA polymerase sigma-70 factor (ECF subfamily)